MTQHSCCILTIINDQMLQAIILSAASEHLHTTTGGAQGADFQIDAPSACEIMYNVTQNNWTHTLQELFWKFLDKLHKENSTKYGNSHCAALNHIAKIIHEHHLLNVPTYYPFGADPNLHSRVDIEIVQSKNEAAVTEPLHTALGAGHTGESIHDNGANGTYPSNKITETFQIAPADSNTDAMYAMNILLKTKSS